jgi:hypothetical protein
MFFPCSYTTLNNTKEQTIPSFNKHLSAGTVHMPVFPPAREAEAGGSLELRSERQAWAIQETLSQKTKPKALAEYPGMLKGVAEVVEHLPKQA